MTRLGVNPSTLYGYVNGNRMLIQNTVEQICAFLMKYRTEPEEVLIVNMLDELEIKALSGFIFDCKDQQFLKETLLPELVPYQLGEKEMPDFVPYMTAGELLINNVRYHSQAGYALYTLTYEEGYSEPYVRTSGYYKKEKQLKEAFPHSISVETADEQAEKNGWLLPF